MDIIIKYLILISFLGLYSCSNNNYFFAEEEKTINYKEIEQRISEHKLKYFDILSLWKVDMKSKMCLSKKIDDFNFTATYKPYSILTMDENDSLKIEDLTSQSFRKKLNSYSDIHFIMFNIENKEFKQELIKYNIETNQGYYDRISYYSFLIKNDVYLIEDTDTLTCSFVNFERTYEANPTISISLAFSRKSKRTTFNNLKLVYEDRIFNNGKLMFDFNTEPILLLNYLKPSN